MDNLLNNSLLEAIRLAVREEVRALLDEIPPPPVNEKSPYLTIREASKLSSLAIPTLRLYIRRGKLRACRVGRRVVIKRKDLEGFLNAGL